MPTKTIENVQITATDPGAIFEKLRIEHEEIRKRCWWSIELMHQVGRWSAVRFPDIKFADLPPIVVEERPGVFDALTGGPVTPTSTMPSLGVYYVIGNLIRFSAAHEEQYHVLRYEWAHLFYKVGFNEPIFKPGSMWANVSHGNQHDPWLQCAETVVDVFWEGLVGHQYRPVLTYTRAPEIGTGLAATPQGPAHVRLENEADHARMHGHESRDQFLKMLLGEV